MRVYLQTCSTLPGPTTCALGFCSTVLSNGLLTSGSDMNNDVPASAFPPNLSVWGLLWGKITFLAAALIGRHQPVPKLSRSDVVFACLCLLPTITLFLLTFDRFLPVQDGWFHYYGKLQEQHEVPYRDFYYFSQPIPLLMSRFLVWLSPQIIYFRVSGIIERCLLGVIVYLFLRRRFTPGAAFFGTSIAMLMYQANYADVFYSYYQTCLLFFMLSQYCCVAALDNSPRSFNWLLGSGVFSALAFFTKQSSGAFAIIGTLMCLALSAHSVRQLLRWTIP
jgi:hypothetical protein